jgi:hypothetical protein
MSLLEDDQIIQFRETGSIFRCHSQTRIVQPLKTSLSWTALCYTGRMPLVDGALLHGHDASQQGTQQAIDMFLAEVCTGLPPNIVATPAPQRRARCKLQATEDGLPRRSARVVAQGWQRVSNPEVQAQNIQMCKLEITLERRSPDMDAIKASSALRLGLRITRRFGPSSRRIAPSCRSRRWTLSLEDRRSSLGCSIVRHVL